MRFYDALQLDPSGLKKEIHAAQTPKERWKMTGAMVTRSFLIVLFSILVISPVSTLFGPENSAMAVAMLCILLGIRFVDFGYCMKDSLINLAIVFALLLLAPTAADLVSPLLAAIIHCSAFFVILFMTSDQPELGNAGLYSFAYIYLAGNPVTGQLLWKRAILTLGFYLICGAILYTKHHKKKETRRFKELVTSFSLRSPKTQWQLQLALGVGLLLALGSLLNTQRSMWSAFACASILGCYSATSQGIAERFVQRIGGTLVGSAIFLIGYLILPSEAISLFGPLGGIILGFCTNYRYKTASNCLGALMVATGLYGLQHSVLLRIMNNFFGVLFGCVFLILFQTLMKRYSTPKHA